MKKLLVLLLLAVLSFSTVSIADDLSALPGLAQEGERIIGSLEIGRDFPLQVDMPAPKAVEGPVKQYQMRRIEIATQDIRALLKGRTQAPKKGEQWEIWTIDRTEYRQFIYQEEALVYALFYPSNIPLPLRSEAADSVLDFANQQAKLLLDTWGVLYEYPFYQVCNIARGADVSLRGAPIHTGADMKNYLLGISSEAARYEYDYLNERRLFDDEYTYVRARQQLDGIPFAICDIKSPNYRSNNPQFDEGIFVLWQFNSRGEIVFAEASNLHEVVAESGESQPVLSWQECLASLPKDNRFFDGLLEAKVVGAELCYAINGKHMTYPVWQFLVEFSQAADSGLQRYLCYTVYVDACSGLPL